MYPVRSGCRTAADHLADLSEWQKANGHFRRLPPTATHRKLVMWVQQSRTTHRQGRLDPSVAEALSRLVPLDPLRESGLQQPPAVYAEAMHAIAVIRDGNRLRLEDMSPGARWRSDARVQQWLVGMQQLAAKQPISTLIDDLAWMIPGVFNEKLRPHIHETPLATPLPRGGDAIMRGIAEFARLHGRLPSFRSEALTERHLASWLIRLERDLEGERFFSEQRDQRLAWCELERVFNSLADHDSRHAEWRWWVACAMSVLEDSTVGDNWHNMVFKRSPRGWDKKPLGSRGARRDRGRPTSRRNARY